MQITKDILLSERNISNIKTLIKIALNEDLFYGDATTETIFLDDYKNDISCNFISKADGIISGLIILPIIIDVALENKYINNKINFIPFKNDGDEIKVGEIIGKIEGELVDILKLERIFLNFLSRMSGISTEVKKLTKILEGKRAKIYDTRKTLPGFRILDKYSVNIGGGTNHRLNLGEYLMIKDNYLEKDLKKVLKYLEKIKNINKNDRKLVEIEIDNEAYFAYDEIWNADIIMLDNMNLEKLEKSIKLIRNKEKEKGKIYEIEISGNMSMEKLNKVKDFDIDRISFGYITHSVKCFDISLDV